MEEHTHVEATKGMTVSGAVILGSLIVGASVLIGAGMLRGGSPLKTAGTAGGAAPTAQVAAPEASDIKIKLNKDDRVRGDRDARYLLVEYSDIDCPFCSRVHPTLEKLSSERDDVSWVYRHFPLESIHPEAFGKAVVAECAAEVKGADAFWSTLDAFVTKASTAEALATASLTEAEIQECVDAGRMDKKVRAQMVRAAEIGTRGTPNTIIWDTKTKTAVPLSGAQPLNVFEQALDSLK